MCSFVAHSTGTEASVVAKRMLTIVGCPSSKTSVLHASGKKRLKGFGGALTSAFLNQTMKLRNELEKFYPMLAKLPSWGRLVTSMVVCHRFLLILNQGTVPTEEVIQEYKDLVRCTSTCALKRGSSRTCITSSDTTWRISSSCATIWAFPLGCAQTKAESS